LVILIRAIFFARREGEATERAKEAKRTATFLKKANAAGPSAQKQKNNNKDMVAKQRAAAKKGASGLGRTGKKAADGGRRSLPADARER
jgi:hypothetical protein